MNPERSREQIVSAIVGFVMLAVASPCVLAMFHDLLVAGTDNVQGALIVGVFMGFVGIAGIVLMALGLRKPKPRALVISPALERQVLAIAREHGGRITVAELALQSELSLDDADDVLTHFEQRSAARTHLSDGGDIVYVFGGLTVDKDAAIDPLDEHAVFDAALDEVALDLGEEEEEDSEHAEEAKQEKW